MCIVYSVFLIDKWPFVIGTIKGRYRGPEREGPFYKKNLSLVEQTPPPYIRP